MRCNVSALNRGILMVRTVKLAVFLFCLFPGPAVWSQSRITLEDLLSIESPGAPALSPDGKTFAITRGGQIFLIPAEGGWPVTLTTTQGGKTSLTAAIEMFGVVNRATFNERTNRPSAIQRSSLEPDRPPRRQRRPRPRQEACGDPN